MAYDNVKEVDCLDVSKEGTEAWDAACKRYLADCDLHCILSTCVDWFLLLLFIINVTTKRNGQVCKILLKLWSHLAVDTVGCYFLIV